MMKEPFLTLGAKTFSVVFTAIIDSRVVLFFTWTLERLYLEECFRLVHPESHQNRTILEGEGGGRPHRRGVDPLAPRTSLGLLGGGGGGRDRGVPRW